VSARPVPDLGCTAELRAECDRAWALFMWCLGFADPSPSTILRDLDGDARSAYERAELRYQSALWYQAVFSRRWVLQDATEGYPDAVWWWMWRRVLSLRWALAERRSPPSGFNRSREIALRDPGTVVGSGLFRPE
jgi:hypothetical protein